MRTPLGNRPRPVRVIVPGLLLALASGAAVHAQAAAPCLFSDFIMQELQPKKQQQKREILDNVHNLAANAPLTSPASTQVSAAASTGAATLVNGAAFPELLGLAIDSGLVSSEKDVLTLDLSPFAFLALARPSVLDRQSLYEQYTSLRRFGGALSFGGKGEAFDRDGDGAADPALEAKELGDIVNWEFRYRVWGSRDRRDPKNVEEFSQDATIDAAFDHWDQAATDFKNAHMTDIVEMSTGDCVDAGRFAKFIARPEVAEWLNAQRADTKALADKIETANKKIDSSMIWTLVAGGVDRRASFGADKRMAALRGARGLGTDRGLTVNLEWSQTEGLGGAADPELWKAGVQYSVLWLKNSVWSKDGITVSWSGAYEMYDNVPSAKHDTLAKLNTKLEFPLTEKIKIPVSITWANHRDLIDGEDELQGHIGFSVDLSKLKNLKK